MQILSAPKAPDPAQSAAEAVQPKPLPGQDGGAGTGEINPSNIGELADKDREMTDYEKAVVKSFDEARAEEDRIQEAKAEEARRKMEEASHVDVAKHTSSDALLKNAAGTDSAQEHVSVSQAHKDAFCNALVSNSRYTERFSLFGGKLSVVIRSRTLAETDAIEAYLRRQVMTGSVNTTPDYSNLTRKVLLAAQVQELNGVVYEELKAPLTYVEKDSGLEPPGWEGQVRMWEKQSGAVAVALIRCITEFEARYWFMVDNANDTNFWNRGESTAE